MKWRLRRGGSDCSAGINLTPVPNADDPNHQLIVLQGADDSIISNPVFPEITSGPCNLSPIFWGSSSFSIRLRRNLRIRLAIGLSSFRSCLRALLESSMFQAIEPHHFPAERSCFVRSGSLPAPFGEVDVFQVIQILKDRFASVVRPVCLARRSRRFSISSGRRMASMGSLVLYRYCSSNVVAWEPDERRRN